MTVRRRLLQERERLVMSQAAFFAACGVSKKAQFNFENDHNIPGGAYLIAAAALGVDVLYVLTGQRSKAIEPMQELPRQEQAWLEIYRNSSESVRAALKAAGDELTKPARKKNKAA